MEKMNVICPHCKSLLALSTTKDIVPEKTLQCPACGYMDKIGNYKGFEPQANKDSTTRWVAPHESTDVLGSLFVDGKEYPLRKGTNTIGRKAKSSMADIQILTNDPYMSRLSACITVIKNKNGHIEHQIQTIAPKNPIIVNGQLLQPDDVLLLEWDSTIILGNTEIRFDLPASQPTH